MQRQPVSCGMASLTIALNVLKMAPWREQRVDQIKNKNRMGGAGEEEEEEEFNMVTEDELVKILLTQV